MAKKFCSGQSMEKNLIPTFQMNFVLIPSEAGMRTQFDLKLLLLKI